MSEVRNWKLKSTISELPRNDKWDNCPIPLDDESFLSWFTRLAKSNYSDTYLLYNRYIGDPKNIFMDLQSLNSDFSKRQHLIRNIKPFLDITVKDELKLVTLPFLKRPTKTKYNYLSRTLKTTNYCPACLIEDKTPFFRYYWQKQFYVVCHIHNVVLSNSCPHCYSPIKFWDSKWNESITYCTNCQKDIIKDRIVTSMMTTTQNIKFQQIFLTTYKKNKFLETNFDSETFFEYFMRVMVAITNDQLIKQISYQDIEIPNDQLFNGILLAFNYISKDIKRMYRPYMCETEYELFESLEELQDHNQAVHNQIKLPEDIDAYTKHRYEMIAPLINMHHRTEDMVIRRSKMYDSSPSAIYRCLKEYDNYGIDGLKCHYSERGRKKIFDGEVIRKIVSKHIKCECNCCDNRSTIINQYAKITEECLNIGIPIPSFSTIYRMKGEIFRSSTQ